MTSMIAVARRGHGPRPETLSTTPFAPAIFRALDDAALRGGPGAGQAANRRPRGVSIVAPSGRGDGASPRPRAVSLRYPLD